MARNDRRFARFYYDDFQRDYPDVYANDAAFSSWMRLLVIAERAWPAPAELPRSISQEAIDALEYFGLIVLGKRDTFSVKGHNEERTRRRAIAVAAASAKGAPSAVPNGAPSADPRREQDENKTSTPPPQVGRRNNGTNPRATGDNPRSKGTSPRQKLAAEKRDMTSIHDILERSRRA